MAEFCAFCGEELKIRVHKLDLPAALALEHGKPLGPGQQIGQISQKPALAAQLKF